MENFVLDELGYKYPKNNNNRKMYITDLSNPYSIENIKNYIKINNLPMELISTEYKGTFSKLQIKYFCCNKIVEISWHSLRKLKQYKCYDCYYKMEHSKDKMLPKDKVLKEFDKNGYILLEEYKNTNKSVLCKNKDGYIGVLSYSNMKMGKIPYYFKKTNSYTINNIKQFLLNNNAEYEILSNNFNGYKDELKWKCKICNKEFYNSWGNISSRIKNGHNKYCNNCRPKSYNEVLTSEFLNNNSIEYKEQYIFENCKNIRYLPFDFYIPTQNICIEVDGEQHFKPTTFGTIDQKESLERFKEQIKRDNIKTNFCKENNIKLIRLSYKDFGNDNYINKLNQLLE